MGGSTAARFLTDAGVSFQTGRVSLQDRIALQGPGYRTGRAKFNGPRLGMRRRFAAAAGVPLEELVNGPKAGKRKK
jgi:hypothetical protein